MHQLRNSFRFIPTKFLADFIKDIKTVYQAADGVQGMENLLIVKEKWGVKYPQAVQPWLDKWALLSPFFDYPPTVRKVMYTTNAVEGYHRQLRKVTKTKAGRPVPGFQFGRSSAKAGVPDDPKHRNKVGNDDPQLEDGTQRVECYL